MHHRIRFLKALAAVLMSWAVLCAGARAGLSVALTASVQNGAHGTELVFRGTLTSTNLTTKIFLNDVALSLSGASLTNLALKPNTFFANVPGVLLPGESYTNGELFRVSIDGAAPPGDYGGTVIFRGGDDIAANDDLASANFAVLSPAVTLVATDATASEQGPDSGTITISRSGSTAIPLSVSYTIGGTAANGGDYQTIPPAVTIAAGSGSATVTIAPLPNEVADGDRTVTLALAASASYQAGAAVVDTVTIHDKPADAWRLQVFGAEANQPGAADGADYDGDGLKNLIEYALGLDPKVPGPLSDGLPSSVSGGYLSLSFVPNPAATDVSYAVEASTNLLDWSTAEVEEVTSANPNPPGQRSFRYKHPVTLGSRAFLRLKVSR